MKKHTHKYERRKLGSWKTKGHDIYKCAVPGCTHYMLDMEAVVGRFSQCWGLVPGIIDCQNEVEMTRYLVFNEKRKHPICDSCKEKRKLDKRIREKVKDRKIERILDMLGDDNASIDA